VVARGRNWPGDHLGNLDRPDLASGAVLRRDVDIPEALRRSSLGTGPAPMVDAAGNAFVGTARPLTRIVTRISHWCAGPSRSR